MKMSPDYITAYERMKPGVISSTGFLGNDIRGLVDIIQADEEIIANLNLTWETVVSRLYYFMQQGNNGFGEPVTVDEKWLVCNFEVRGTIPCPFGDGLFEKITVTLEHKNTAQKLYYSALSLHLMEKHHFLQGKGADFRIEPGLIKSILEL